MLALWVVEADFMHSFVFLLLLESRFILLCSCCYESWDRSVVRDLWVTFRGSSNERLASLLRQCKSSCGRAWGTEA